MVSFVKRRFQVFVSSTYSDLREERQAAVEAILSAGHIPAGMELFAAGDESQMEVIKQWIDESDVYLLILAGRYGSIDPSSGKSYIQLEYEYAQERQKPFFACVISESALELRAKQRDLSVIEREHGEKMSKFRSTVLRKLVKFWEDSKDIKIAIGETLAQFSRREDIVGWVREDQAANVPALADEITRLSKENARLRAQTVPEETINGVTYAEMQELLEREGAIDFLRKYSKQLANGLSPLSEVLRFNYGAVSVLQECRIVEHPGGSEDFVLTDSGYVFLNRLKVEDSRIAREHSASAEAR